MNSNDRTLWMGDLDSYMDANFLGEAFARMGEEVSTIKIVYDKYSGKAAGYCFVELTDGDSARRAMLNINGKVIPKSKPPVTFNLSFANSPSAPYTEYNLFVNNIPYDVDDAGLFLVFGDRYRSCRGAKVYRNSDGTSKGLGFVRFADQTDQQTALVEMNKFKIRGKEIILKLAQPKYRAPKSAQRPDPVVRYEPARYYAQYQDFYNSNAWQMYDIESRAVRQPTQVSVPRPQPAEPYLSGNMGVVEDGRYIAWRGRNTDPDEEMPSDPEMQPEYYENPGLDELNELFMKSSEELYAMLEQSKFNPALQTAAVTENQLLKAMLASSSS